MTGYNFACKSIGMDCGFEIRSGSSKAEVLEQAVAHARHAHQITTVSPELAAKVDAAIRA